MASNVWHNVWHLMYGIIYGMYGIHAEVEYPCLSGERRHLPCIYFKDSARPAELPRWLSWYSICLERRRSRVRVLPEAALLFLWKKKELSSGVVACICLVSITDYSCRSLA